MVDHATVEGDIRIGILQLFFCLFITQNLVGQHQGSRTGNNSFFVEASTQGPMYSINYDRIFLQKDNYKLTYRIGISVLNNEAGIPLGINLITGKANHHAEFSLTFTPFVKRVSYLFREGNLSDKYLYVTPGLGYRFQKPAGGIFFRGLVAPLILLDPPSNDFWNMDPKIYSLLSLGAGFSF